MSTTSLTIEERQIGAATRLLAYVELTKPRILVMVLLTVAVSAFAAAAGRPDLLLVSHVLVGTALIAGSGSALNQWLERSTDARMPRTADRPIPSCRLTPTEVLLTGSCAGIAGCLYLATFVGLSTTIWGTITWLLYVCAYTPLKRRTPWNTAVGAVAGALPIIIGWSAVASSFEFAAWVLFGVVFLWQFPHFMSIAWLYRADYERAGLKMLPVVDRSGRRAGRLAIGGAMCAMILGLVPFGIQTAPCFYLIGAFLVGAIQLMFAVRFAGRLDDFSARRLLRCSLIYLPAMLAIFAVAACT